MRTAFICVTVTVTSPLERIYISAGVTRRPFGFQPKGWCLSRSRNGSAHFRRYFAMGKIRGTQCMRRHICAHRATTKYFSNSFVFKTEIEKEGLPGDITPALGAGGLRFKSGRPDQNISRVFFRLSEGPFIQNFLSSKLIHCYPAPFVAQSLRTSLRRVLPGGTRTGLGEVSGGYKRLALLSLASFTFTATSASES